MLRPGLPNAGSCVLPRTHTQHPRPRRTRNPSIHPRTVGGPAMQAPTSKKQGLRKKIIAISKFHRRGEHCSPAKALCCRKAPRVEQSPTPTINRKRMREIFIALSQFHRRGGAPLRPGLPNAASAFRPAPTPNTPALAAPATQKIHPPHRWRACHAGPYKQKARLTQKRPQPFLLYSRGEHCSPAKALCCRKVPRVEQSPTPTINRKRMREILSPFRNSTVGAGLGSARPCRTHNPENIPPHRWRACHAGPYKRKARLA